MKQAWRNRIIGHGEEAPDQLAANPRNWRIHPKHQQDALAGVIRDVGLVQTVLVNQATGFVVDGHLRVSLALRENQPTIPVTYVDLSEDEEALILATFDPIGALAGTDTAQLDALLREVSTDDAAVQQLLDETAFDVDPTTVVGEGGDNRRQLARAPAAVKAVFSVAQLAIVEAAIKAAGTSNRGEALTTICEAYLAARQ